MSVVDPGGSNSARNTSTSKRSKPPARKSIHDRIAGRGFDVNPLVTSSLDTLSSVTSDTGTFTVDMTGELVLDQLAPLPITTETAISLGELDYSKASEFHLLLAPDTADPAEIEALAISVWNEAGWLSPGNLRLQEGCTLEGPWFISEQTSQKLSLPPHTPRNQVYLLRAPALRGARPTQEVKEFSELARAFPDGMPVGIEDRVLEVLQRICRRLGASLRIAGSGYTFVPDPEVSVDLRVYASSWLSPEELFELLGPRFPGLRNPNPLPVSEGGPYALIAPIGSRSQIMVGVRLEQTAPRALRWEMWAKERMYLYEIVWARPEDLYNLETTPTRAGRLERSSASRGVEEAAALIADMLDSPLRGGAAIIDEDEFLVGFDVPHPEEEEPHP